MFVFTLVQSRTHVSTVCSVSRILSNSRDICWSHTMKVLGWHATFVTRNSPWVLSWSSIYVDMKVWSLMYVVSVQSVFVQCMNWNVISWYTRTTNSSVVVCVVKILNTNVVLYDTLRNVPLSFHLHVEFDVYDWVWVVKWLFDCCRRSGKILEFRLVSTEISVLPDSWLRERNVQWSLTQLNTLEVTVRSTLCLDVVSRLSWNRHWRVVQDIRWCQFWYL